MFQAASYTPGMVCTTHVFLEILLQLFFGTAVATIKSGQFSHAFVRHHAFLAYLLKRGTTWNHLKPPRNYLKMPETSNIIVSFT